MTDHHLTLLPPCGAVHHDDPPSDASAWCAHWAAHGARVLSEDEVAKLPLAPRSVVRMYKDIIKAFWADEADDIPNSVSLPPNASEYAVEWMQSDRTFEVAEPRPREATTTDRAAQKPKQTAAERLYGDFYKDRRRPVVKNILPNEPSPSAGTTWNINGYDKNSGLLTHVRQIPPEYLPGIRVLARMPTNTASSWHLPPTGACLTWLRTKIPLDVDACDWFLEPFGASAVRLRRRSETGWKITGYKKNSYLLAEVHAIPPECLPEVRALSRHPINFLGAWRLESSNALVVGFRLGISLDVDNYNWFLEDFS